MSQNVNSMSYWLRDNYKAERLKFLLKKYNIDTAGLQEVCINWAALKPSQTMASLLRHEASLRSVHSHNKRATKNIGRQQRGGTATIINERLAPFVKDSGTDHTGLGRWSWYLLEGTPGHKTRVITAYAPCGDANSGETTVFAQHMNYIRQKGLRTNPKAMFRDDLLGALRIWRNNGEHTCAPGGGGGVQGGISPPARSRWHPPRQS